MSETVPSAPPTAMVSQVRTTSPSKDERAPQMPDLPGVPKNKYYVMGIYTGTPEKTFQQSEVKNEVFTEVSKDSSPMDLHRGYIQKMMELDEMIKNYEV